MQRNTLVACAALFAASLLAAPAARAQLDCLPPGSEQNATQPVCNFIPKVNIIPATTGVSQPAVTVVVTASDEYAGAGTNIGSFQVLVDGTNVTQTWNVVQADSGTGTGLRRHYRATGIVTLSASQPQRTVSANMCDTVFCNPKTATYTLGAPGVSVTPDGPVDLETPSVTRNASFTVQNTGSASATFALTAQCRIQNGDPVTPCTPSSSTITLAAGASGTATVLYPANTPGQMVSIQLEATQQGAPGVRDAGWRDVVVHGPSSTAESNPQVSLVPMNAGSAIERSQCVTIATATGAAYECGDLRVAHALPAHRTRGRTWAPALVYNSQHAHPRPIVYADVTLPAGSQVPSTVQVKVLLANGAVHTATYTGGVFSPGMTRRVGVQWDGLSYATNVYGYSLEVTATYASGSTRTTTVTGGEIAIVNRSASPFGAGWWLAGWEQILCLTCGPAGAIPRMLWIGGDGSTRIYESLNLWTSWVAQNRDGAPDTLRQVTENGLTFYKRRLPGGTEVHLDGAGQHFRTVNRLGQVTYFDIQSNRLAGIYAPTPTSAVSPAWLFLYNGSGKLWAIEVATQTAPTRVVYLNNIDGRVMAIQDPDNGGVGFVYESVAPNRITAQLDRRGAYTVYGWDAFGKLASSRLWMGSAPNDAVDPRQYFGAGETRGVALAGSTGAAAAFSHHVTTTIDGPRGDVQDITTIWHNAYGNVRRTRDPMGGETLVTFGDAAFPALPTKVVAANGMTTRAFYDFRGRVDTMTVLNPLGTGHDVRTVVTYDDRWDKPTTVRTYGLAGSTPTQLGGTSYTQYDATTGNVLWQQQGEDAARRVNFYYSPSGSTSAGQLDSIVSPAAVAGGTRAVERLRYDAVGNLKMTISPTGLVTLHTRDGLGRDSIVYTPIADSITSRDTTLIKTAGARVHMTYDAMDRVVHTRSVGPAMTHPPTSTFHPAPTGVEEVEVETTFDPGGLPLYVSRWSDPDSAGIGNVRTEYEYDRAGRKVRERTAPDGNRTFQYDFAGNLTVETTPRGHQLTTQYDALDRPTRRVVPSVTYAKACDGILIILTGCEPFPRFPNDSTRYTIPEEWSFWRYDAAGNMVHAENRDAIVQRSYFPNGAVRTDTTRLRTYEGATYTDVYGLRYTYDLLGRVTSLQHPTNLASGTAHTDSMWYEPVTGELTTLKDRRGNTFGFRYDLLGRTRAISMPGQVSDSMQYDLEGRLAWRYESGVISGLLHSETMQYDARGKLLLAVNNGVSQSRNWYSGTGMLVANDWQNLFGNLGHLSEETPSDPLGNVYRKRTSQYGGSENEYPIYTTRFTPGTSRVSQIVKREPPIRPYYWAPDSTAYFYDNAGNNIRSYQYVGMADGSTSWMIGQEVETRSYYGADGRLRAFQKYDVRANGSGGWQMAGVWEEYRYDPLGRRIMVRTRGDGGICNTDPWRCTSSTTRFVWAGDQLLWELKAAQGTLASAAGGNVSYTHGGGIDRPLVITKNEVSVVPHQNWRGQFTMGTWGVNSGGTVGAKVDCTSSNQTGCLWIPWPGQRTNVRHALADTATIQNWFGGLVDGMRDASGQMYMRNRYYDPASGQFTQPDPIGLAGGLNAYGFADGDPVSYSDPYGLQAGGDCRKTPGKDCPVIVLEPVVVRATPRGVCSYTIRCRLVGHVARFRLNNPPLTLAAARRPDSGCVLLSPAKSRWHRIGPGNENNLKYVCGGHNEAVFRPNGERVTDCVNGGTYNYGTNDFTHFVLDIVPYLIHGNCPK